MPEAIITNVDDLRSCVDSLVIKAIQDCEDQYSESVASLSYILSVLLELRPLAAREKAAANYRENIENVRQKFAEQFNNCSAIESVPPKFRKTLEERFLKHSKAVAGSR